MSNNHDMWAESLKSKYKGLGRTGFGFWDRFLASLMDYSEALNKRDSKIFINFVREDDHLVSLTGPIVELHFLLDPLSQMIHYSFTSKKLVSLWASSDIPSRHGTLTVNESGLLSDPPLSFVNLGNVLELNDVSDVMKASWPIHDIAAMCFVEKLLDASTILYTP